MSEILRGAIDTDVHCEPTSMGVLHQYFDAYWHEYIRGGRIGIAHSFYPPDKKMSARPEVREAGAFPAGTYEALKEQFLDPYDPEYAVLNCLAAFQASRNPYYDAALTRALNEWIRDEFLERDARLRASILVPSFNPEAAAEEIDRLAADRRFVQVLLPIRSDTPWGNLRWRAIHEAAARNDLPLSFHAWGPTRMAPTTTGYAQTYFEDYLYNSHIIAPAQVLSLISEGVFDRYPQLRVGFVECGFSWLPSLIWRFDKDWKALWREVPWVRRRPSEYVQDHIRLTTSPAQIPKQTPREQVAQLAEMLPASKLLMYSSDFPHDHGDDALGTLLELLGEPGRSAVVGGNAADFYRLVRNA